jgi:hypothetical protein
MRDKDWIDVVIPEKLRCNLSLLAAGSAASYVRDSMAFRHLQHEVKCAEPFSRVCRIGDIAIDDDDMLALLSAARNMAAMPRISAGLAR